MPLDPEKLRKSYEALESTPEKGLRSYLVEVETHVLELRAKKHTYRYIRKWLLEHLDMSVPLSTLYQFAQAAEKRGAENGNRSKSRVAKTTKISRKNNASKKVLPAYEIQVGKPNYPQVVETAEEHMKPSGDFDFDENGPLIPNAK